MPLPEPKDGETKQEFISRCIETLTTDFDDEFPSREQRAAVCYSQWNQHQRKQGKKDVKWR